MLWGDEESSGCEGFGPPSMCPRILSEFFIHMIGGGCFLKSKNLKVQFHLMSSLTMWDLEVDPSSKVWWPVWKARVDEQIGRPGWVPHLELAHRLGTLRSPPRLASTHRALLNTASSRSDYLQIRSKEILHWRISPLTQAFGKHLILFREDFDFCRIKTFFFSPSIFLSVFKRLGPCGKFNPHVYDSFQLHSFQIYLWSLSWYLRSLLKFRTLRTS